MPKRLDLILGRLILTQRISAKNVIDFHNGYGLYKLKRSQ